MLTGCGNALDAVDATGGAMKMEPPSNPARHSCDTMYLGSCTAGAYTSPPFCVNWAISCSGDNRDIKSSIRAEMGNDVLVQGASVGSYLHGTSRVFH